jgi:hypothetical protein
MHVMRLPEDGMTVNEFPGYSKLSGGYYVPLYRCSVVHASIEAKDYPANPALV